MSESEKGVELQKEKNVQREKIDFDVYECDHDKHIILIAEDPDRNLAEDLIQCPYHKCPAEFAYSLRMRKNLIEDIFWERIDP